MLAPATLLALINHFKGSQVLTPPAPSLAEEEARYPDLIDIKGQEAAKRALEVAAAGGHNLLMIGPPGTVEAGSHGANPAQRLGRHAKTAPQTAVLAGKLEVIFTRLLVAVADAVLGPAQLDDAGHNNSTRSDKPCIYRAFLPWRYPDSNRGPRVYESLALSN